MKASSAVTAVVVPARNEARTIGQVLRDVRTEVCPDLLYVVDDGSSDGTGERAHDEGATVLRTSSAGRGLGAAMSLGLEVAAADGAEVFLTMDADAQYRAADLSRLRAALTTIGVSMAVGHRLVGGRPPGMRPSRYLTNSAFSGAFSGLLHTCSLDAQSGLRAFTREVAVGCATTNQFTYTQEQILRAALHGLSIASVPVQFGPRAYGESRLVRSTGNYARNTVPHLLTVYGQMRLRTEGDFEPLDRFLRPRGPLARLSRG